MALPIGTTGPAGATGSPGDPGGSPNYIGGYGVGMPRPEHELRRWRPVSRWNVFRYFIRRQRMMRWQNEGERFGGYSYWEYATHKQCALQALYDECVPQGESTQQAPVARQGR